MVVPRSEGKEARPIGFRGLGIGVRGVVAEGGGGADKVVIFENPVGEYGNAPMMHLGFMG